MTEDYFDEVGTKVLTYWFGTEYWKNTRDDPPNCSAYFDDLWIDKWFAKEKMTPIVDGFLR